MQVLTKKYNFVTFYKTKKLRPTRITGKEFMTQKLVMLFTSLAFISGSAFAQVKEDVKLFEEAYARNIEPQAKIYVKPQTCDLTYMTTERQMYGPYEFKFKGDMSESFLENAKNRALFQACLEDDADMMVGALFDSYVTDSQPNVLQVRFLAYPVKFVNFRALGDSPNDFEMVRTVYPSALGATDKVFEEMKNTGKRTN